MHIKCLATFLVSVLLVGCSDHPNSPVAPEGDEAPLAFSVDRQEYSFPFDLDDEAPWIVCNGELMQGHGILQINIQETTTPSGNALVSAKVDYPGVIWYEGLVTHDVWNVTNGHNPFGEVIKDNGFYVLHYHITESWAHSDGRTLKMRNKGHVKIDSDGNVTIARDAVTCS